MSTTTDNNKLIADFMGGVILLDPSNKETPFTLPEYNNDWNELMPVIAKLSDKLEEPQELDPLKYALLTGNLDEAYSEVVEAIENL